MNKKLTNPFLTDNHNNSARPRGTIDQCVSDAISFPVCARADPWTNFRRQWFSDFSYQLLLTKVINALRVFFTI